MPGMPGGLSMSEMGQAAQKIVDPFAQTAKSQLTGTPSTTPQPQTGGSLGGVKAAPAARPPSETTPTSGTFDLSSLAQGVKQQVTGAKPTPQGFQPAGGMQKPHMPSSQPPSEFIPKQTPADMSKLGGDIFNLGEPIKASPFEQVPQQQQAVSQIPSEEQQKKQMEEQKQMEILRNKLHDEAVRKTMEVGQTQKNKEEEQKKSKEQQEQEEQEKKRQQQESMMETIVAPGKQRKGGGFQKVKTAMSNMLNSMLNRSKGSKEGKGGKG